MPKDPLDHPLRSSPVDPNDEPGFLDKPRDSITDDRRPGEKLSIRELGQGVKEGVDSMIEMGKQQFKNPKSRSERGE